MRRLSSSIEIARGSVLISSLVMLFILVTIFLAILTFALQRYGSYVKAQHLLVAGQLAEAGIRRALARLDSEGLESAQWEFIAPNGGVDSVTILPWGPFILVQSLGIDANQRSLVNALVGMAPDSLAEAAVVIGDERLPLVGAGQSLIVGDVITGPQGVTTGRIKGKGPAQDDFVKGRILVLPKVDLPKIDSTELKLYYRQQDSRIQALTTLVTGSLVLSVERDRDLFVSGFKVENSATFDGVSISSTPGVSTVAVGGYAEFVGHTGISGTIEFSCSGPVIVTDSAVLDQIILISPDSIVFSGHSRFSGIAISGTSIDVRDSAQIQYPAFLMLDPSLNEAVDTLRLTLRSMKKSEAICYAARPTNKDRSTTVVIDSLATLEGYLMAHDKAEIRGKIFGTAMTERFEFTRTPTTYINWLDDAYINRTGLNYDIAYPMLTSGDRRRCVIISVSEVKP